MRRYDSNLGSAVLGSLTSSVRCHGAMTDVAAAEALGPADAIDGCVGARLRLCHRPPDRRDIEHAPAIGKNAPVLGHGAGMEDLDTLHLGRRVQSFDQ